MVADISMWFNVYIYNVYNTYMYIYILYIYISLLLYIYTYIYVYITIWGWPPWDHYTIPTQLGTPPFHPGLVSLFHCFSTVPFAGAVGAVLLLVLGVPKRAKATVSKERIERSQAHILRGAETMGKYVNWRKKPWGNSWEVPADLWWASYGL